MKKKIFGLLAVCLACLLFPASAGAEEGEQTIVFVHTNDVHGYVDVEAYVPSVTAAYRETYGQSNVIQVSIGDVYSGSVFASLPEGEKIPPVMNAAGYQAMVIGNADILFGKDQLLKLAGMSSFPLLSANASDGDGSHYLDPYTIFDCDGLKIGVFGITTPDLKPPYGASDEKAAAEKCVADLKEAGCDFIVALTHIGYGDTYQYSSDRMADEVAGIDLILDGHSHTVLERYDGSTGAVVVQAGAYGDHIGVTAMTVKDGAVTGITPELISQETYTANYKPNTAVQEIIDAANAELEAITSEVVGTIDAPLDGERENVRTRQTSMGSFITDAMRYATGADIGMFPGALIRSSVQEGNVTLNDTLAIFSSGADIYCQENVTGAEIRAALNLALSKLPEQYAAFQQVSGIKYTYMLTDGVYQAADLYLTDGTPIADSDTFTVAYDLLVNDMLGMFDITGLEKFADGQVEMVNNIILPYLQSGTYVIEPDGGGRAVEVTESTGSATDTSSSGTETSESSGTAAPGTSESGSTADSAGKTPADSSSAAGKLPDTGERNNAAFALLGLLFIAGSFYACRKAAKKV